MDISRWVTNETNFANALVFTAIKGIPKRDGTLTCMHQSIDERDRQRDRDRQTDRQTEIKTERQTDTEREKERTGDNDL